MFYLYNASSDTESDAVFSGRLSIRNNVRGYYIADKQAKIV